MLGLEVVVVQLTRVMFGEIVVGQVSKSRIRARCDESARPDFAKTNLLLMKEEEGEDGGKGDNEDVQEDVEKKILKGPEIFHWSFELTAAGRSLVRVQLRSVLHLLCIKAATG